MIRQSVKGYAAAGAIMILALAMPLPAFAGVDINISVPLFGLFTIERQPVVVAPEPYGYVPNRYVDPAEGAVFYGGYWYRWAGGNWFIAAQAGGPWSVIGMERVPYAILNGPVLMEHQPAYGSSFGIVVSPWYGSGWHGGGRGRGHDD
jgi:hypothetical protein